MCPHSDTGKSGDPVKWYHAKEVKGKRCSPPLHVAKLVKDGKVCVSDAVKDGELPLQCLHMCE